MTIQKRLLTGLAGVSLIVLGACTSGNTSASLDAPDTKSVQDDAHNDAYVKPGASINFSHNYDGKTDPGEIETFQIFVKGAGLFNGADITMQNNNGLKIYSDATPTQKLLAASDTPEPLDETMNMSVGAQTPGRYYLKFLATATQGDGTPIQRAYAIAIQVGDQPYVPELGKGMTAVETPEGEKIITMEAQETIEN